MLVLLVVTLVTGAASAAPASAAGDALTAVTISTDTAAKPTVQFAAPFEVDTTTDRVVAEGTGEALATGATVTFDYVLVDGRTGAEVETSYGNVPASLVLDKKQTVKQLVSSLTGKKVGSRVVVAIAPKDGLAARLTATDVKKDDTLLFVIDLKGTRNVLKKATGQAVAPVAGLPTVKLAKSGKPTITVPKGKKAPTHLVVQPLVKGTGAVVQSGQTVGVQYTGVIWATGKQFDSSWARGAPFDTPIGQGNVIAGWDEGLVGQTVGSQVLLVVPPDKGYGSAGTQGIKGTDTLVFVVDILDAY
jgi:peptidylprolyl isomerase